MKAFFKQLVLIAVFTSIVRALHIGSKVMLGMRKSLDLAEFHQSMPALPAKLIVGYANWNQCDDAIIQAVQDGVNVVIWFATNLAVDTAGLPVVTGGPDMDCVADKIQAIRSLGLPCVHLISIGGWNSPHPDTSNSAKDVFASWQHWNHKIAARPAKGFYGFHGFDWDIEGNDDHSSPYNHFTVQCLDLMGQMSQQAQASGYIVSMAPAESYVDLTTSAFDRSLQHEYPEWVGVIPTFPYHGQNTYSHLLAKYGKTTLPDASTVDTFNFITIQLYEGYSHAEFSITQAGQVADDVLVAFASKAVQGWEVDFTSDTELAYNTKEVIRIKPEHLVIGLANGWAGDGKFLLVYPEQVGSAYKQLEHQGIAPRGFAFWNILDEGKSSPQRPNEPVFLAKGLNAFMQIRPTSNPGGEMVAKLYVMTNLR